MIDTERMVSYRVIFPCVAEYLCMVLKFVVDNMEKQ